MELPKAWLLLLYGLPGKKSASRVNLWRKLKKFGAVPLKNSAYILPDSPVHFERFQWLAKQVRDQGGEASLVRVSEVEGLSGDQIADLFRKERTSDYTTLHRDILAALKRKGGNNTWEELQQRFQDIQEIDYFESPTAHKVSLALQQLEKKTGTSKRPQAILQRNRFLGKTWLTRPRPQIDRVGSAWLIKKFIDPQARFIFSNKPEKFSEAIPYDMMGVELTHHGEDCTFETLVKRFNLQNATLGKIAEMIHDADLEDGKFKRHECLGIDRVLKGWASLGASDEELLEKGGDCFDALYEHFKK